MRVLLVVHGYPPAAQGGTEIYAESHARILRREFRDDVCVLAREQDPSRPELAVRVDTRDGVRIARINNTFRHSRSFEETYANRAIDAVASRLIDDFEPDLAHVHHLTCLSTGIVHALAERHVPVVMTLHDYWLICHRGQLLDESYRVCRGPEPDGCRNCLGAAGGIGAAGFAGAAALRAVGARLPPMMSSRLQGSARRVSGALASGRRNEAEARKRLMHMREVCGRVTMFFAPSEHLRRRFIEFGIAPERIQTAPYGIAEHAAVIRQPSERLRFGFVGSLMVSKAPHLVIDAIQRLPPTAASLDIFGSYAAYHGDDSYWRQLAPSVGDRRVRFHGAVPHERVSEVLSALDVLVVPSIWPETSPIVIREALAAGVPVVASRIGGIPELVDDGVNGLLFEPNDVADLARVLTRLLDEPGLLDTLRRGIKPARTLSEDVRFTRVALGSGLVLQHSSDPTLLERRNRDQNPFAIVLNFGAPDDAILAVRSLQASRTPLQIVVVDNGSDPACRDALAAIGGEVNVIQTGRNLGFSGGMNVGFVTRWTPARRMFFWSTAT